MTHKLRTNVVKPSGRSHLGQQLILAMEDAFQTYDLQNHEIIH